MRPDSALTLARKAPRIIPESFALSTRQEPVEFVMRRQAVILLAALVWLISIEGAEAGLDILVDKATQRMMVIQDGYVRYIWPVSTGRDNMATPNGVYAPQRLERNWFSKAYYDSPMPYSIFFHNGYAIHGSYAIDRLGGPASHGCVRLHPYHAELLFDLVQQEGPDNTTIEVTDGGHPDEPPPLPEREIPPGQGVSSSVPRPIHYREAREVPELPPAQPVNRLIAAKNALPPRPAAPTRQMLTDVKPPATVLRTSSGAGEADAARRVPRPSNEWSNPRSKPRLAEGPPPEQAQQAVPVQAQQAASVAGFKLLPASCWSGGASRWRWWASSGETSCK
jgi:lipoprotein-anchoring transpeptidase ErfK/SrfK